MSAVTSQLAHADIKPKAPSIRVQVLDIISRTEGISRTQIATQLNANEITVGSRITELLDAGLIRRKEGQFAQSTSGKKEHLYVRVDGIVTLRPKLVRTVNRNRLVEILKHFGITPGRVNDMPDWYSLPEGSEFWYAVYNDLYSVTNRSL